MLLISICYSSIILTFLCCIFIYLYFIWFAHWYVINATHYQEHSFTYWKRVYTRIFTATLHLLKGTSVGFFFCKINTTISKELIDCLCSEFPVWNTVGQFKNYGTVYIVSIISIKVCSDTDLAYPSPVNKVVRISPWICIHTAQRKPTPPPHLLENRENLYVCDIHVLCTCVQSKHSY